MIKLLTFASYLATIKNAAGAKIYRNSYALVDGRRRDLAQNGRLSCGLFVSSVLLHFRLIKEPHLTVNGTIKDLKNSGWKKTRRPKPGCVLVWEADEESLGHEHVGFYLGQNKAISNSSRTRTPVIHHWTYGIRNGRPKRRVLAIYWQLKFFASTK